MKVAYSVVAKCRGAEAVSGSTADVGDGKSERGTGVMTADGAVGGRADIPANGA